MDSSQAETCKGRSLASKVADCTGILDSRRVVLYCKLLMSLNIRSASDKSDDYEDAPLCTMEATALSAKGFM